MSGSEYAITGWTKLGGLIRDARQAQAITQADLAGRAGVARSWLARVEAGHRGAELEPLLRLLDALGMTMTLTPSPSFGAPRRDAKPHTGDTAQRRTASAKRPGKPASKRAPAMKSFDSVPGAAGEALKDAAVARRAAWGLSDLSARSARD